jgi:hypothetical protein
MIRQAALIAAATIWAGVLAFAPAVGHAQGAPAAAKPASFSCTGVKIEPVSMKQSPMTVKLGLVGPRKIVLNFDNSDVKSTVTDDNQITLNFRTRDFTGEFFHYTNDLFLIYHSGHLAKLACTPAS